MSNTARGWRRIGIVLSVIWFLGFGVYSWGQATWELELLKQGWHNCTTSYELSQESARKYALDADDMIKNWTPGIEARTQGM